ncbi:hypothetical protein [Pseudonocardia alni]|uniref:hypothetical protein n=1 Tax=Pseudonocardia alni TaxID=33907 RepID=UPI0027AA246F|nr:hypothetical protein PaSha_14140 [Pseudonocardia alni]WFG47470.1 hypothetical protein PaSha_28730 [Pseudonocardia alni]
MSADTFARRVRNTVRAAHASCDPPCALARLWAEDVAEVLETAERVRRLHETPPAADPIGSYTGKPGVACGRGICALNEDHDGPCSA